MNDTKTENPHEIPVHPPLARILAGWKLSGSSSPAASRGRKVALVLCPIEELLDE